MAALAQCCGLLRRQQPALADLDKAPTWGQQRQARTNKVARQRVEHNVDPSPVRQRLHLFGKGQAARVKDMFHAERAQIGALFFTARRGDDFRAQPLRDLHGSQPDTAGCGMNQHALARTQFAHMFERIGRRYKGDGNACALRKAHPGRQRRDQFSARYDMAAQRARRNRQHALTQRQPPLFAVEYALTHGHDHARAFAAYGTLVPRSFVAGDHAQRLEHILEIQPGGIHADFHLAAAGIATLQRAQRQPLQRAALSDLQLSGRGGSPLPV